MRTLILLTIVLTIVSADKWAVLVAGSNTWSNYRHQADIFHAYQLLLKNAFDPQNIITFAYDDIANDLKNPFRGKVFNKPSGQDPGVDVYEGVKIDYSKNDVTPDVFLSVLMGNKTAVKGKGSEKVLESTADDNVFLFFSDHGAVGLIAFPTKYLYADSLLQTFAAMKGRYKKLVFYLEACESGSMFLKLPNNTGIYALSAANPTESSWATYCSPNDVIQGKHIGSCLGDLFSCNFIEETEKDNFLTEKLNDQFLKLKYMTTESEVMQWGDKSFLSDKVGDFVAGYLRNPRFKLLTPLIRTNRGPEVAKKVDSRTNKLQALAAIYAREHSP